MAVREKIENIQALRGVAVLLVILYHAMLHERKYGHFETLLPDLAQIGASGVDLFFVISGFVITTVTRGRFQREGAVAGFVWNRATRIYPLFWFYWLLFVLAFYIFPQAMATTTLGSASEIARSFLLLPQERFPILSVSWTLVHEMYFYLVFSFFIFWDRKRLPAFLLAFLSILVAANIMDSLVPFTRSAWLKVAFHPLTMEFLAGCLISELVYESGVRGLATTSVLAGVAGLVVMSVVFMRPSAWEVPEGWMRVASFGVPSAAVVYGAVAMEVRSGRKISRILNVIGDASYSIYLSHAMVFSVIGVLFGKVAAGSTNAPLVIVMLAGALAWGLLSYFFIERPALSAIRKAKTLFVRQPPQSAD